MMVWILAALAVLLLASLLLSRPRFRARLAARGVPSRTETLIGKTATVTEAVDPNTGTGRVLVENEDWAAHSPAALPAGTVVRVTGADGIILNVSPSENNAHSTKGPL